MRKKYNKVQTVIMKYAISFCFSFFSVRSIMCSGVLWQEIENISLLIIPHNIPNTYDSMSSPHSMMGEFNDLYLLLHLVNSQHNVFITYDENLAQPQGEK